MPTSSAPNNTMMTDANSFSLGVSNSTSAEDSNAVHGSSCAVQDASCTGRDSSKVSTATTGEFIDRRQGRDADGRSERRQFGSSHEGLTENGRELAMAIDQYKLQHHRRYITCDEMLAVLMTLGYQKCDG